MPFIGLKIEPAVPMPFAVMCVGAFILSNAGRMIAAMAMINGSVEPRKRGGFMSANSAIQHLATGRHDDRWTHFR